MTVFSLCSCSAKKDENGITSKSETQISSQQSETDAAATTEKINTYTGLSPLPKVHFNVEDPENKSGWAATSAIYDQYTHQQARGEISIGAGGIFGAPASGKCVTRRPMPCGR